MNSFLFGVEPHRAIEHVASGEVQQSVGVLVKRVVLDVDSVTSLLLELAHPHVGEA